jgi:hypothetical protein
LRQGKSVSLKLVVGEKTPTTVGNNLKMRYLFLLLLICFSCKENQIPAIIENPVLLKSYLKYFAKAQQELETKKGLKTDLTGYDVLKLI